MPSNLKIEVTAETVDATAKLAIFRQELKGQTAELASSVAAAREAGSGFAALTPAVLQDAEAVAKLKTQIAAANAELKNSVTSASQVRDAFGGLNSVLGTLGLGVSAAAILDFGKDAITSAADIAHMAETLGISTDDLQSFQFAARASGVEIDDANTMLRRFLANLGGIQQDTGPGVAAIKDLGLTADELAGDPMTALSRIANALLKITDPAERARDEVDLFGRSGLDLNIMLPKLAQGFDKLGQQADAAGQRLSESAAKGADEASIKLSLAWNAAKNLTAEGLLDWAEGASHGLRDLAAAAGDAGKWIDRILHQGADANPDVYKDVNASLDERIASMKVHETQLKAATEELHKALAPTGGLTPQMQTPQMPQVAPPDIAGLEEAYRKAQEAARRAASATPVYGTDPDMMEQVKAQQAQMRQMDQSDAETAIRLAQIGLDQKKQIWSAEVAAGQITKAQEVSNEIAAEEAILGSQLKAQDDYIKTLAAGTAEFERAENERKVIAAEGAAAIADYQREGADAAKQAAQESAKSWIDANKEVISSEDQLISGVFENRQKLSQLLLGVARDLVEKELEADIGYWTERGLLAIEGVTREQTAEKGGVLMDLLFNHEKTTAVIQGQAQQTGAVAAGTATQTAIKAGGATASNAAEASSDSKSILNSAYVSAAGAYKSVMQSVPPPLNLILAPIAAAGTFAAVAAYDVVSAEGGEWTVAGDDIPYRLHNREGVMPAGVMEPMRDFFERGAAGRISGGDTHYHTHNWNNAVNFENLKNDFQARRWFEGELRNGMRNSGRRVR